MLRNIRDRTILKLYVSNFLTGLVFWYGIEKLFMQHIGITAEGIGMVAAALFAFNLLFDIPSGMLADRWSRKGLLVLSTVFLALSSVIMATSHGMAQYLMGALVYGAFFVTTSGTYQALTYDILASRKRATDYSRVMGAAFGLFLIGWATADVISGLLVDFGSLTLPFWLSIIPCIFNFFIILSIPEPAFHKKEQPERLFTQMHGAVKSILSLALLRSLTVVWLVIGIAELFKDEFGQLYILHFTDSATLLGIIGAFVAVGWSIGSFIAHRFKERLNFTLVMSMGLLVLLGLVRSAWGMGLFLAQCVFVGVLFNLIETRIQDATPSSVRASILSVYYSLHHLVSIPAALLFGWVIRAHNIFWAVGALAIISALCICYWLFRGARQRIPLSNVENSHARLPLP